MYKNKSGQKLIAFLYDSTSAVKAGRTGDAANLTARVSINGGAAATLADTSASEIDSTNLPGWYQWDLSAAETNGNILVFRVTSSTANTHPHLEKVYTSPPAYFIDVAYRRDESNVRDEYDVRFYDGAEEITGGISSANIVVKKRDGTDLVASTALTNVAGSAVWQLNESTNRQTAGDTYAVMVTATIDGVSRTLYASVGRD